VLPLPLPPLSVAVWIRMVTNSDDALFNAEAGIGFKTAKGSADCSSVVSQDLTLLAGGNLNLTSTSGGIHVAQGVGVGGRRAGCLLCLR